jgi:hypothetical protein
MFRAAHAGQTHADVGRVFGQVDPTPESPYARPVNCNRAQALGVIADGGADRLLTRHSMPAVIASMPGSPEWRRRSCSAHVWRIPLACTRGLTDGSKRAAGDNPTLIVGADAKPLRARCLARIPHRAGHPLPFRRRPTRTTALHPCAVACTGSAAAVLRKGYMTHKVTLNEGLLSIDLPLNAWSAPCGPLKATQRTRLERAARYRLRRNSRRGDCRYAAVPGDRFPMVGDG